MGPGFESQRVYELQNGLVAQLVRVLPCHGRSRGFKSRPDRKEFSVASNNSGEFIVGLDKYLKVLLIIRETLTL